MWISDQWSQYLEGDTWSVLRKATAASYSSMSVSVGIVEDETGFQSTSCGTWIDFRGSMLDESAIDVHSCLFALPHVLSRLGVFNGTLVR